MAPSIPSPEPPRESPTEPTPPRLGAVASLRWARKCVCRCGPQIPRPPGSAPAWSSAPGRRTRTTSAVPFLSWKTSIGRFPGGTFSCRYHVHGTHYAQFIGGSSRTPASNLPAALRRVEYLVVSVVPIRLIAAVLGREPGSNPLTGDRDTLRGILSRGCGRCSYGGRARCAVLVLGTESAPGALPRPRGSTGTPRWLPRSFRCPQPLWYSECGGVIPLRRYAERIPSGWRDRLARRARSGGEVAVVPRRQRKLRVAFLRH